MNQVAFMPGSFNPIHSGHRSMAEEVELRTGKRVVYMITSDSVHKPTLATSDLLDRAAWLRLEKWQGHPRSVIFTRNDPLFIDKARRNPGATFVIGADTVVRMLDAKWGPDIDGMLTEMRRLGTRFLVFGREIDGNFIRLEDIAVPEVHAELFTAMPGRWNVSSTELRGAA